MRALGLTIALALSWSARAVAAPDLASVAQAACSADLKAGDTTMRAAADVSTEAVSATAAAKAAADRLDAARKATIAADTAAKAKPNPLASAALAARQREESVAASDATTSAALADEATRRAVKATALATATATLCGTPAATWKLLAGKQYPKRYLARKLGVDACVVLPQLPLADGNDATIVATICTTARETSLSATGIGLDLVQGLGDLLESEAKQEITQYLIEQVGKKFCAYSFAIPKINQTVALRTWFPQSCKMIDVADVTTFTFGDLAKAFKADLVALPAQLSTLAQAAFPKLSTTAQDGIAVAGVLALVVFDAANHKSPLQILDDLGSKSDGMKKDCDFTKATIDKECVALLLFDLARAAANDYSVGGALPSKVISDALDDFCKNHGVNPVDGACVIDATSYEAWHERLLALYRAIVGLTDLQADAANLAATATHREISNRLGPELGAALKQLVVAFAGIVEKLPGLTPAELTTITDEMYFLELGLDIYAAIVASDALGLRQAVIAFLKSTYVAEVIPAADAHAITVIISLATAKDRAEVKDILADVTAPVGTYKMKYGADHEIITLNGNVGFLVGGELRFNSRSADGTSASAENVRVRSRLSAPVGLDFTPWSWDNWHLGFTLTAIDPLALAVSDANSSIQADWKTIWDFGAYVRIGIYHSPFVLMLGARYQPYHHADDGSCGAARCFDGTLEYGGFLSADIPLFVLR